MRRVACAAGALACVVPALPAQSIAVPHTRSDIVRALAALEQDNEWTLTTQVRLCEVPAPPFREAARAAVFRDELDALGLHDVRIDGEGNVIGELTGSAPGPTVMLSGHLDTVFPEGTDVSVTREGSKLSGAGIGDDCRGLAAVLAVTRALIANRVTLTGRVLVVGTVGEEGAGNLRGVRALFDSPLRDSVDAFLSVDGTGLSITNGGVGSARYRISVVGPGGHSYGAFGMPNPIHALGRAISAIADVDVPRTPKTTFNVGIIDGGTSVNTISADAAMDLDMRSESTESLLALEARVMAKVREAVANEQKRWPASKVTLALRVDTIGIRPAGVTSDTTRLVRAAQAAGDALGQYTPLKISSTDANYPMSLGIPSVAITGGGVGTGGHSLSEAYDDRTDGYRGPQWILLLVATLLGADTAAN